MQKPQIVVSLNFSCKDILERNSEELATINCLFSSTVKDVVDRLYSDGCPTAPDEKPAKHRNEVPTSRHHQSVAANTRIMDAIEFINKEMRLLKGHSENGTLKVFEELKGILLGI